MSQKIMLKNVRLSFPSLFTKSTFEGNEGKFEATFLIPKSDKKTYKAIMAAIEECKSEAKLNRVKDDMLCIKDGDEIFEDKEYDGYEDHWAIKAGNTKRPLLIDNDKSQLEESDNRLYAGCYVNAQISPWAQDNKFGKRINANLLGVQFVKDGDPFGDAVSASADDFDDESDDYDDEEL